MTHNKSNTNVIHSVMTCNESNIIVIHNDESNIIMIHNIMKHNGNAHDESNTVVIHRITWYTWHITNVKIWPLLLSMLQPTNQWKLHSTMIHNIMTCDECKTLITYRHDNYIRLWSSMICDECRTLISYHYWWYD